MFPLAFTNFLSANWKDGVEILFFLPTTGSTSSGTNPRALPSITTRAIICAIFRSRFRNITSRVQRPRDLRFLRPGTAPDSVIVDSIIRPVRLTSSFAFTLEDSSRPRVGNEHSSQGDIVLPLMRRDSDGSGGDDRNSIELQDRGCRSGLLRGNGITKIARVANTSSILLDVTTSSHIFWFSSLSLEGRMESCTAFAIIFVLSGHVRNSTIGRMPSSPMLRALAEHIRRHCSYSNARQDPRDCGCL